MKTADLAAFLADAEPQNRSQREARQGGMG
jgi:hypothetical protein